MLVYFSSHKPKRHKFNGVYYFDINSKFDLIYIKKRSLNNLLNFVPEFLHNFLCMSSTRLSFSYSSPKMPLQWTLLPFPK